MACPRCGAQNTDDSIFCKQCGERLGNSQPYGGQQGYQPLYGQPNQQSYQHPYYEQQYRAADSAATGAMVCGIIGLFVAGLILGIVALVQGNKAKKMGYVGGKATAGIVLGIIDIAAWAIILIAMFRFTA